MQVHVVGRDNAHLYADELRQDRRHQSVVSRRSYPADLAAMQGSGSGFSGRCGSYGVQVLIMDEGAVLGGFRACRPHHAASRIHGEPCYQLSGLPETGVIECSPIYRSNGSECGDQRARLGTLMVAAMLEYGVEEAADFITFRATSEIINMMVSLGLRVEPMYPVDACSSHGPTLAGYLHVSAYSLAALRLFTGLSQPLLQSRDGFLPSLRASSFAFRRHAAGVIRHV